jgi:Family of unknown function (DUF6338)
MMAFMPTTLTGLLLFVVLLLPGFTYAIGKERNGVSQGLTPFRETAAVVVASVSVELVVLSLFAVIRTIWPSVTPNVGALIRNGGGYLRGTTASAGHYAQVTIWAAGMLAFAVLLAYLATLPGIRRIAGKALGPYPHDSTVSGWWIMFEKWQGDRDIHVGCILDDGSFVEGTLGSFSRESDDSPDRDLILQPPIRYRPPGADELKASPYVCGAVCFSAARIVSMFVSYPEKDAVTSSSVAEAAAEQVSMAEDQPSASDPS